MTSPPPSPPSTHRRPLAPNKNTHLPTDLSAYWAKAKARGVPLNEAYSRAFAMEGQLRLGEDENTADGYRLYLVTLDATVHRTVGAAGAPEHLVVGRHTSCDVLLPEDAATSLRHVLVRATTLDDGLSLLSLLDLETGTGFELGDGSRQRAAIASGAIAFRVGETWLLGLPRRGALPTALDRPEVRHSDVSPYRVNPNAGYAAAPELERKVPRVSRISIVPASVRPTSVGPGVPVIAAYRPEDAFEITLQAGNAVACVRVSERDVEHGVLLGRDPRCIDAGVRAILNEGVSRVHALAIRERDAIRLYDVASTNGISPGAPGAPKTRALVLADGGTTLYFHGQYPITVHWRAIRRPVAP
jgi:hypothetical protein